MNSAPDSGADPRPSRLRRDPCHRWFGPLFRSPIYRLTLSGRTPHEMRLTLPFSWPEDRAAAQAIMDGAVLFAGRRVPLGPPPWPVLGERPAAAVAFHGFGWLTDLRAVGSKAAQFRARELVEAWIDGNRRWSRPAWCAEVLARRLLAWLIAADFLLASADDALRPRLLASAAAQARHLRRVAGTGSGTAEAVLIAKALLVCAICLGIGKPEAALARLGREIEAQVRADGGHIQRNPAVQLAVLRDLLDVRAALQAARMEVPAAVLRGIDRMVPMLRAFRLGDGLLAAFNGGTAGDRRRIDAVLARAGVRAKAIDNAAHSGFQRLAAGRTVILVDAGPPPPPPADRLAHAGVLSFELSIGRERLVVNCGAYLGDDPDWHRAMRESDAHSTLIVADASSSEIRSDGHLGHRPREVRAARREAGGAIWLDCSHNGYARTFDVIHRRRLYLHDSGRDIRGEDLLEGHGRHPFRIRFHLHPRVQASPVQDGTAVLLKTAGGSGWRFLAVGGRISVEDSVYLGDADGMRRSMQIVVSGAPREQSAQVKWAFRHEGGK